MKDGNRRGGIKRTLPPEDTGGFYDGRHVDSEAGRGKFRPGSAPNFDPNNTSDDVLGDSPTLVTRYSGPVFIVDEYLSNDERHSGDFDGKFVGGVYQERGSSSGRRILGGYPPDDPDAMKAIFGIDV